MIQGLNMQGQMYCPEKNLAREAKTDKKQGYRGALKKYQALS
jgi:hypothetical protein